MSKKFYVVSEARADFVTATELADRVLLAKIDWIEVETIEFQREWIGEDSPGSHLAWTSIPHRARELGITVRGHFNGESAPMHFHAARRAILYVLRRFDDVDAIVLIRDLDDQRERRDGIEQARGADSSGKTIVVGVAHSERECWVVSGFDPESDDEKLRLGVERQKLGANPCLHSEELTACKREIHLRSPKRVLKVLTGDDWGRQRRCWTETSLDVLSVRGTENGLADYLKEVEDHLVPVIAGQQGHP